MALESEARPMTCREIIDWAIRKKRLGRRAGAPPGTITSPCLEQVDDLDIALPASGLLERTLLRYRPPAYLSAMSQPESAARRRKNSANSMRYRFAA